MELTHNQYKESEMGVIPVDWEVTFLENVTVKVGSGITPTGGEKVYKTEGRPFLRSQNIGWGKLLLDDVAFIDDVTHSTFSSTEIIEHDVFLNITGASIGRCAVANNKVVKGNVNQHVCIIRPNKDELIPEFLNYFLLSHNGQKQIDSYQAGGNRQGLNFGQIKSFLIPIPTKSEQTAIATALSDMDSLIENLEKLISKKRNIKLGVMQELLSGKRRLEGFTIEWRLKQVGNIAEVGRGRVISHREINKALESKYPVYSSQTSNDGIMGYLDTYDFDGEYITWTTDGVNAGKVFHRVGRFNCTNVCGTIKLKSDYPPFVALILDKATPKHVSKNLANPKLMNDPMKRIEIFLPEYEEQKAIADLISEISIEINYLNLTLTKYRNLKQGMMQALLTGKIRLV